MGVKGSEKKIILDCSDKASPGSHTAWIKRKDTRRNKARKRTQRRRIKEGKTAAEEGNEPKPSHPPRSQGARNPTLHMAGEGVSDNGDNLRGGGGEGDSSKYT
jgi:hypothetical protein